MSLKIDHATDYKIRRLERGLQPRVLDLFAGCGGFSLGFQTAGFTLLGAVECDLAASRTHSLNLLPNHPPQSLDIKDADPDKLANGYWGGDPQQNVDVIVGGPPCQTFARIGRAKLRSQAHREADWLDRASLYSQYLRFVERLRPLAIVFENVPDILNYGGGNIAALICEELEKMDYIASCTLLNSVFYGVPQLRERLYLIAYHRSLGCKVTWPDYTHDFDLPNGYEDIRAYARRQNRGAPSNNDPLDALSLFDRLKGRPMAVSARAALEDLPHLDAIKMLEQSRWDQRTHLEHPYPQPRPEVNSYGELMRNWPGFETKDKVTAHITRRLPRDFRIFAKMAPGDQYPRAHSLAERLFSEELDRLASANTPVNESSSEWEAIKKAFVPPYSPKKFPNKWRKIDANRPSRTLMAHLSHDSYSHIHYDNTQARTITVREAARLQSFPDGFRFDCSMNDAFKQIGNAVPPLVSLALAREIGSSLGIKLTPDFRLS
ncbi:MAG: DNA cytosine methyltransferase [Vulcanimicrobiota bacterium]